MEKQKTYLGYTHQQWQTLILFALLVAVMILAYNIGHYDSLQYQKICSQCNRQDTININISKQTIDYGKEKVLSAWLVSK